MHTRTHERTHTHADTQHTRTDTHTDTHALADTHTHTRTHHTHDTTHTHARTHNTHTCYREVQPYGDFHGPTLQDLWTYAAQAPEALAHVQELHLHVSTLKCCTK